MIIHVHYTKNNPFKSDLLLMFDMSVSPILFIIRKIIRVVCVCVCGGGKNKMHWFKCLNRDLKG